MTPKTPKTPENPRAEEAFTFYASLPAGQRTYAAVAAKLGVSLPTVKRWGTKGNWQQRVAEREVGIARKATDQMETAQVSARSRQLKLLEVALVKLVNAIAEGTVRGSYGDLERLLRLEGFIKGTDKSLPIEEVHRIFEHFLRTIEQEIHDPEQRQRIADAVRSAIEAAQAPRRLGTSRTG